MLAVPQAARQIINEASFGLKFVCLKSSPPMGVAPAHHGPELRYSSPGTTLVPITLARRWATQENRDKASRGEPIPLKDDAYAPTHESADATIANWIKQYDHEENRGLTVVIGTFGMSVTPTEITLYAGFVDLAT